MSHRSNAKQQRGGKINSIQYDKGKKHFWNSRKKDYGFCQSSQTYDQDYLYNNYSLQPERRRHSTIGAYQYQRAEEEPEKRYQSVKKSNQKHQYYEEKREKRNLLHISNNIQVKLPAIKSNVAKAQPQNSVQTQQSNYSKLQPQITNESNVIKHLTKRESIQRVKTETQANVYSQRGRKVRYSPTYVCSFTNPLPTFKLYQTNSRKAVYQYGYGEQQEQQA